MGALSWLPCDLHPSYRRYKRDDSRVKPNDSIVSNFERKVSPSVHGGCFKSSRGVSILSWLGFLVNTRLSNRSGIFRILSMLCVLG